MLTMSDVTREKHVVCMKRKVRGLRTKANLRDDVIVVTYVTAARAELELSSQINKRGFCFFVSKMVCEEG